MTNFTKYNLSAYHGELVAVPIVETKIGKYPPVFRHVNLGAGIPCFIFIRHCELLCVK